MAVDSTTVEPVESAAEATTDEAELETTAGQETEDTSQTSDSEETESEDTTDSSAGETDNSEEAELKDWAAKKNLPLDDPVKLAKMYRESEKQLGKKGQKEGQLKTAVQSANTEAGVEDLQALRNEVTALSFYVNHPEAKQFEPEMVSILEEKPWLANDLDIVLDVAKGRTTTEATRLVAERQAGKKEALAAAEQAGRAAQPRASASNSATTATGKITPANVDEIVGQHAGDAEWYKKNLPAINAALAG